MTVDLEFVGEVAWPVLVDINYVAKLLEGLLRLALPIDECDVSKKNSFLQTDVLTDCTRGLEAVRINLN